MPLFQLASHFKPCGDQPQAIDKLTEGLRKGFKEQVLLGVTGSGKTFTMANVISRIEKPTLVISHNKTLAAQLYSELKGFFPHNAVEYFVSYYDYYQPEAYVPHTDTYIAKDASINQDLDRLRLAATSAVLSRDDVIVVSSVSSIYNIGSPEDWSNMVIQIKKDQAIDRDGFLARLVDLQYNRSSTQFERGFFRVRGDIVDLFPSYQEEPVRIEFFGSKIDKITILDKKNMRPQTPLVHFAIYPAKQFVTNASRFEEAFREIRQELAERVKVLESENKMLEAKRLQSRTNYDLEMIREVGYCSGIENYARHLSGRPAGSRPYCLFDYFPKEFLLMIDESHVSIPQIRGMYNGDKARKQVLVDYGFRLPSALDNRPLQFNEFEALINQVVYVSATPGPYEMSRSQQTVEQLVRPTGVIDPEIIVRTSKGQIDDLIKEVKIRAERKERILITTLTKRMSEDLSRYLTGVGIRVKYLHSEIDAIERVTILKDLRREKFDCLVGINLLREGLDLPEVSLVIILDADKEGFLRSEVSLLQTAGRAARHVEGKVIMYADRMTDSMLNMISESSRRRQVQIEFNKKNNITPKSIIKAIQEGIEQERKAQQFTREVVGEDEKTFEAKDRLAYLERKMEEASRALDFERAARLRDKIMELAKEYKVELPWEEKK